MKPAFSLNKLSNVNKVSLPHESLRGHAVDPEQVRGVAGHLTSPRRLKCFLILLFFLQRGKRVPAKRAWVRDMPEAAAAWLHTLPFSLRIPAYGITIVHAGIVPDVRFSSSFGGWILYSMMSANVLGIP